MRKAFSMMTALVVIVMMASIAAMVFSVSGKIVKQTTAQYRYEQAALLAKSYTEAAILAIQNTTVDKCPKTLIGRVNTTEIGGSNAGGTYNGEGYYVVTRIKYIGLRGFPSIVCAPINTQPVGSTDVSVMIDVDVRYKDPDAPKLTRWVWTHYRRRTLQRL